MPSSRSFCHYAASFNAARGLVLSLWTSFLLMVRCSQMPPWLRAISLGLLNCGCPLISCNTAWAVSAVCSSSCRMKPSWKLRHFHFTCAVPFPCLLAYWKNGYLLNRCFRANDAIWVEQYAHYCIMAYSDLVEGTLPTEDSHSYPQDISYWTPLPQILIHLCYAV